jgi:hypothetical protein
MSRVDSGGPWHVWPRWGIGTAEVLYVVGGMCRLWLWYMLIVPR